MISKKKLNKNFLKNVFFFVIKGDDETNTIVEGLCRNTWIGTHKIGCGRPWVDVDDGPIVYTNWKIGEPNNRALYNNGSVGPPVPCDSSTDQLWQGLL